MMTAAAYLNQLRFIDAHIDSLTRELQDLEDRADSLGASSYEPHIRTSGSTDAPFVNACIKIADTKLEINREIDRLNAVRRDIKETIEAVPNETQKAVLRYKFINGMRWEEVAEQLCYSVRRVYQIYAEALDSVEHILMKKETLQ